MNNNIEMNIHRIIEMEKIFNQLQSDIDYKHESWYQELLKELIFYYESNDWKEDYHLDELGLLPSDLKRGILSEDGIYNFISSIENE